MKALGIALGILTAASLTPIFVLLFAQTLGHAIEGGRLDAAAGLLILSMFTGLGSAAIFVGMVE